MSKILTQRVKCNQCDNEDDFPVHHSVNVSLDPDLKERVFKKDLFNFSCDTCGCNAIILHDFLYHDMKNKFIIQYLTKGQLTPEMTPGLALFAEQGYKIRVVGNLNDLIEKILIFDQGLKDTAIEVLKATIMAKEDEKDKPVTSVYFAAKSKNDNGEEGLYFVATREKDEPKYLTFLMKDIKTHLESAPEELAKWPDPKSMIVNFKTMFPEDSEKKGE